MRRRILTALMLITLMMPLIAATSAPARFGAQTGGAAPVAVRIPHALVDTVIEPLAIVNSVPQITTSPWTVGWYQETGSLGVPGNPVMYGLMDWWQVGPAVFFLADQLRPGNAIEVTGSDGYLYAYQVEWIERYPRVSAPIGEIFARPTDAHLLTLFFNGTPFNGMTGGVEEVVVVRARQTADISSVAPSPQPAALAARAGCPVIPGALELPLSPRLYPYPVVAPDPYIDRNEMNIPAAAAADPKTVAALNNLLAEVTACKIAVREALQLPDGYVLALVGPAGALPLPEMRNVVLLGAQSVTDATMANLIEFMLFVREEDGWHLVPHPVG